MNRAQRLGLALLGILTLTLALPASSLAHPLGNFTVNQYTRIEVTTEGLRVVYVLDMAEIPALQEIQERIDTDGDGNLSGEERERYLTAVMVEILAGLSLTVDAVRQELVISSVELTFPEGQASLDLMRLRAELIPKSGQERVVAAATVNFANDYASGRLGWNEVVVTHGPGVKLRESDAPLTGLTDELRTYPEERLSSPLDRRTARFVVLAAPGVPAADGFDQAAYLGVGDQGESGRAGGPVAALLTGQELSTAGVLLSLLLAAVWGAAPALSPGHGKTVVAAYLVGSRGTPRHALFLGATVTVTHTAGVLALGLITLFASRYILPEQLYPWLSLLSGVLVAGMGIVLLRQ
ncbi:MAG: high-affinity nickel-transporter, partial [Chloroflexota bacterium]|nr:high-affinity nickel-transporter [Chloroflexota bacterium]